MVRCITPLRPQSPLVPPSEVAVVKGDLVVVQEICGTSAAGWREGRLRYDGVTFNRRKTRIYEGCQDVPHFSQSPAERLLGSCHAELHLGHMPALVDRQHGRPRKWFRFISRRYREHVHAPWGPCYGAVGSVICMQHDRHPSLVQISCASRHRYPELFQLVAIGSCEGIRSFGVDYAEIVRVYGFPSCSAGIISGNVELGVQTCRKKGYEQ